MAGAKRSETHVLCRMADFCLPTDMGDGSWDIGHYIIKIVCTRQWKLCFFGSVPPVVTTQDESDTWNTGDEKSYQTNDGLC
jgi:hypothetical protein